MVFRLLVTAVSLAWFDASCHLAQADTPSISDVEPPATSSGFDGQVRSALRLEMDGKNTERNALLQQVLEQSPDHPQARWQLGYVAGPAGWVLASEGALTGSRREAIDTYRRARAERGDSVREHLELANLARDLGSSDEERAELTRVLQLDWNRSDARQRLGHHYIEGQWITPEELEAARRAAESWIVGRAKWQPTIETRVRPLRHRAKPIRENALRQLAEIRDPAAIPALEATLIRADGDLVVTYLDWLAACDAWQASVALARQAVMSESLNARLEARQRLAKRRYPDFMPALLQALVTTPQFERMVATTADGYFIFGHTLHWETQDQEIEKAFLARYAPSSTTFWLTSRRTATPTLLGRSYQSPGLELDAYLVAKQHQMAQQGLIHDEVSRWQRQQQFLNDRILRCLDDVAGDGAPRTAEGWWDWWTRYNGIEVAKTKPKLQENYVEEWYVDHTYRRQRKPFREPIATVVRVQQGSCFPEGTLVITESGVAPIEQIRLGDRVLSKDVETGELAFKPVLGTTIRRPVPLLEVATENDRLLCTFGHPFWVNGEAWLMARDLEPGMRLHALVGSLLVTAVNPAGRDEKAYNLIVADFHTYFVGNGRILSHDNTPRAPTNALVPGLMPDYASTSVEFPVTKN